MRRVRRKGGHKEKVFGCDLLEHLSASSQEIPLVLRCCSEFVETHGVVDGIYRLSGVSSNIQKLRGEFEGDGAPDLNKDLYLQDIHCVSSLCKAYFRELPNPLLTYQLYDKFAEAVAIQLEEERLVKIGDVLKELPTPHYRTLEFLMRHLVKMASHSSETNMHSRNLAIVWAPNLLRSKDIEVSGFNGTAAFMEVRVQSIVVEFILTHVAQLFPAIGVSNERRNSLPSPTAASCREEGFFKSASIQPFQNFGNISPGDGPPLMRPYHAIIEGTDKRKGSLKGRKWMSIFNIGGRFHDPRRRQKHSAKEKDRPTLRPARSMDSLSTSPFPKEVSRRPAQHPPTTVSPLVTSSPQPGSDVSASTTGIGRSEYAVTYRRGTGVMSGSGGTQGTYTALDPEGLGVTGSETLQTRSPGLSTKVGRRAAMHITGPTMVTVPLHITSNLALGVLQGGGADRIIHRGREKDGGDRVEGTEGRDRKESIVRERKVEEGKAAERKEMNHRRTVTDGEQVIDENVNKEAGVDEDEEGKGIKGEEKEKEEEKVEEKVEEVGGDCRKEPEMVIENRNVSREQRVKSLTASTVEDDGEDADNDDRDIDDSDEYMDMKDASDILNSTEAETDDLGMSGYVQDNFEFLDQMDFSVLDHMDCGFPYQVNEFSVEPPGHSDDEYEVMEHYHSSNRLAEEHTHQQPNPETDTRSPTELNTHRPLSLDLQSRHVKSLSLPYKARAVQGAEESSSEEEEDDDCSEEDECMFVKSLPCDYFLNNLPGFEADSSDGCALDGVAVHQWQIPEERDSPSPNLEYPPHNESSEEEQENEDVKEKEENDGLEETDSTEKEEKLHQRREVLENKRQSEATEADPSVVEDTQSDEEQSHTLEASPLGCLEYPTASSEESSSLADVKVEEKRESVYDPQTDYPACCAFFKQEETSEVPLEEFGDFSVCVIEEPRSHVRGDDDDEDEERVSKDDLSQEMVVGVEEGDDNMKEETIMDDNEQTDEKKHEGTMQEYCNEEESAIWDELEDIEEDAGITQCSRESVVGEEDTQVGEEGEQRESTSGEKKVEERGTTETEVSLEKKATEEKLPDPEEQQVCEQKETNLPNTTELDEAIQKKCAISKEAMQNDREEGVSKEREEENHDKKRCDEQQITIKSIDKELIIVKSGTKAMKDSEKYEGSDSPKGGVGRKLVVSKQPKFYQVKAVPVVPPKPQHCKITALTLKHQQQQRDRRDADRGRENTLIVPTEGDHDCAGGQKKDGDDESEGEGKKEQPEQRGGERERERRRDLDESLTKDTNRNSHHSMNFEEAVAIITMKREKEKEDEKEKEKERQKDWGNEVE